MNNIYIKHYDEEDSLTHYGVKGMKWHRRKTTLVKTATSAMDKIKKSLDNRLDGKNKTANAVSKNSDKKLSDSKKSKDLGKKALNKLISGVSRGNYGNGMDRINALKKQGLSRKDVIRVQTGVNKQYGVNSGPSKAFISALNSAYGKSSSNKKTRKKRH